MRVLTPRYLEDLCATKFSPVEVVMNQPGVYLDWGVIQISVANLIVIGLMLVVFALALFLPFPGRRSKK
jgi:hypothetical protein